jgi:hypothetical protein
MYLAVVADIPCYLQSLIRRFHFPARGEVRGTPELLDHTWYAILFVTRQHPDVYQSTVIYRHASVLLSDF